MDDNIEETSFPVRVLNYFKPQVQEKLLRDLRLHEEGKSGKPKREEPKTGGLIKRATTQQPPNSKRKTKEETAAFKKRQFPSEKSTEAQKQKENQSHQAKFQLNLSDLGKETKQRTSKEKKDIPIGQEISALLDWTFKEESKDYKSFSSSVQNGKKTVSNQVVFFSKGPNKKEEECFFEISFADEKNQELESFIDVSFGTSPFQIQPSSKNKETKAKFVSNEPIDPSSNNMDQENNTEELSVVESITKKTEEIFRGNEGAIGMPIDDEMDSERIKSLSQAGNSFGNGMNEEEENALSGNEEASTSQSNLKVRISVPLDF